MSWYTNFRKAQEENHTYDDLIREFSKPRWLSIDSSFIDAIAYFESAAILEVRMKNGRIYTFMGIPQNIVEEFLHSSSKGAYFNKVLRQYVNR